MVLIQKTVLSQSLFKLLKDVAGIKNLRLAISSLDFWTDFKETVSTC